MSEETVRAAAEEEVLAAYTQILDAFAAGRVTEYFSRFHERASFLFWDEHLLGSRQEYRRRWEEWEEEDGFRVLGADASDVRVSVFGDTAIVTHTIETETETHEGAETVSERESIVFAREDGRWLAVHEHLSPLPEAGS